MFRVDGLDTSFSGELPTLVVHNSDKPGCVSQVTGAAAPSWSSSATSRSMTPSPSGCAVCPASCGSTATPPMRRNLYDRLHFHPADAGRQPGDRPAPVEKHSAALPAALRRFAMKNLADDVGKCHTECARKICGGIVFLEKGIEKATF